MRRVDGETHPANTSSPRTAARLNVLTVSLRFFSCGSTLLRNVCDIVRDENSFQDVFARSNVANVEVCTTTYAHDHGVVRVVQRSDDFASWRLGYREGYLRILPSIFSGSLSCESTNLIMYVRTLVLPNSTRVGIEPSGCGGMAVSGW